MSIHKPTIAFLAAGVDEPYQITIREGLLEGIRQAGGRLVSIPGIPAFSEDEGKFRSFFSRTIISPGVFDGIIILSSTFTTYVGQDELIEFFHSFAPIPCISLGLALPGIPSVVIDNRKGMTELMEHLFGFHHFSSPVFIGGPFDHPEATERKKVFHEILKKYGLTCLPENIFHTTFAPGSGEIVMKKVLVNCSHFDCVICINDSIALEAQSVIDESNLSTPLKVAVTGYDDIPLGRRQPFSLTTVHQPLHEMGFLGATMMMEILRGCVPENQVLSSHAVLRNSCGCSRQPGTENATGIKNFPETVSRYKDIKQTRLLRLFGIRLLGALEFDEIQEILDTELMKLEAGYIGLFIIPESQRTKTFAQANLFLQFDPSKINEKASQNLFDLTKLFPPGFPEAALSSCLVCPMNFGPENLGYLIFEEKPGILSIYYTLSLQLGNVIKVWELEQKRQHYTKNLEQRIKERTRDLEAEVQRRREAEKEVLSISDREQRRIGQDLHDDICQRMAGISILATVMDQQALKNKKPLDKKNSHSPARISDLMTDVIQRTKALSRGLFPVILDHQGLPAALEELAEIIDSSDGPRCRFSYNREGRVLHDSPQVLLHLYRIAQEASNNAVRHSHGDMIEITLTETDVQTILCISDNGSGFKPSDPIGLGFSTMKYRAGFLGAKLTIESCETGTNVTCILNETGGDTYD